MIIATPSISGAAQLAPCLLFILHPSLMQALRAALSHVTKLRGYLHTLTARVENAQIAKDILMGVVDESGIDITVMGNVLDEWLAQGKTIDGKIIRTGTT